ncbi:hypothetical protein V3851_15155 [Paenibacillus sp. M1]|uniref:DUF2798 domain-containing protein n=1 Tax=Paenibacillus haidiansis TaxID=1574488 RepID=A0ABU7VTU3_9BACL
MKSFGAYLLLILLGFTLLIATDLMSGLSLNQSLKIMTHPFAVLTSVELILIPVTVLLPIIPAVKSLFKAMSKRPKKSQSRP